jgi:hypothetical protein
LLSVRKEYEAMMARRSYARHKFEKPVIPDGDDGESNARKKADAAASDELLRLLQEHHKDYVG